MTQRALIGTAFEYAAISMVSAQIRNDIQKLLEYAYPGYISLEDTKKLSEMRELMTAYYFKFTATSLDKHLSEDPL